MRGIRLEHRTEPTAAAEAERRVTARVTVGAELGGDATRDRAGPVEVVDLRLDRLLAEVALARRVGAQEPSVGEVEDAAAGVEGVAEREGERGVAHEPAEVGDQAGADAAFGGPGEGGLEAPGIPAGRGIAEFKAGRDDSGPPLGEVELVRLALGSAPVVLRLGRYPDDPERRETGQVFLVHR